MTSNPEKKRTKSKKVTPKNRGRGPHQSPFMSLRKYEYSVVREATDVEFDTTITDRRAALRFIAEALVDRDREGIYTLHLDNKNHVVGIELTAIGGQFSCAISPREIFLGALLAGARSVIIMHNHPSNDGEPSPEDISLTDRCQAAGKILGITVLDHFAVVRKFGSYQDYELHSCRPGIKKRKPKRI